MTHVNQAMQQQTSDIPTRDTPVRNLMTNKVTRLGGALAELNNIRVSKMRHINQIADGRPPVVPVLSKAIQCPSLHRMAGTNIVDKLNDIMKGCAAACSRALVKAQERIENQVLSEIETIYQEGAPWSELDLAAARRIRDERSTRAHPYRPKNNCPLVFVEAISEDSRSIRPHESAEKAHSTGQRIPKSTANVARQATDQPQNNTNQVRNKKKKKKKKNKNTSREQAPNHVQGNEHRPRMPPTAGQQKQAGSNARRPQANDRRRQATNRPTNLHTQIDPHTQHAQNAQQDLRQLLEQRRQAKQATYSDRQRRRAEWLTRNTFRLYEQNGRPTRWQQHRYNDGYNHRRQFQPTTRWPHHNPASLQSLYNRAYQRPRQYSRTGYMTGFRVDNIGPTRTGGFVGDGPQRYRLPSTRRLY